VSSRSWYAGLIFTCYSCVAVWYSRGGHPHSIRPAILRYYVTYSIVAPRRCLMSLAVTVCSCAVLLLVLVLPFMLLGLFLHIDLNFEC
jgi:hypothetical protein